MERESWRKPVSDAVYLALCAAFQLLPDSDEGLARFKPADEKDVITPQAPRNANVCYFSISLLEGTEYDFIETSYGTKNGLPIATLTKPIPISVLLTFYGEYADDDAEQFWSLLQFDSGSASARAVLRSKNIVPSGKPSRPQSVYEVEGTYRRRRCDVRMNLLYKVSTEYGASVIESPPEISTVTQNNN